MFDADLYADICAVIVQISAQKISTPKLCFSIPPYRATTTKAMRLWGYIWMRIRISRQQRGHNNEHYDNEDNGSWVRHALGLSKEP